MDAREQKSTVTCSRVDGVGFNQPGEVAGVADVPLHGVKLCRHGRRLAILVGGKQRERIAEFGKLMYTFRMMSSSGQRFVQWLAAFRTLFNANPYLQLSRACLCGHDVLSTVLSNLNIEPFVVVSHVVRSRSEGGLQRRDRDRIQSEVLHKKLGFTRNRGGNVHTNERSKEVEVVRSSQN